MRALIQRVSEASVVVEGVETGRIGPGLAILLGVMEGDGEAQADFLAKKICELRIFMDENEKMNRSLLDTGGELLVVSQFTLSADCRHGRRPSFFAAAKPGEADRLYGYFNVQAGRLLGKPVQTGVFGAHMKFRLCNEGPVTIWLDTDEIEKK